MNKLHQSIYAVMIAGVAVVSPAVTRAQEDAKPQAPQAAPAEAAPAADAPVKILELAGTVQHRPDAATPWQAVTMDSMLPLGSEVRTGPKSMISMQVGSNSQVKLESLGVMTIADAAKDEQESTLRTRLYKKYGKMSAKVQHVGDLRNDYQIATPGATLAVRGSEVVHTGYETWQVEGIEGSIELIVRDGRHNVSTNDIANNQRTSPSGNADHTSDPTNNTTPNQGSNNQTLTDNYAGLGGNPGGLGGGAPLNVTNVTGGSGGD